MAKPRQLKPWPELVGLLPLLKAEEPRLRPNEIGHIDLENVYDVDSLGLAIYLAKLAQLIAGREAEILLSPPMDAEIASRLQHLCFFHFLEGMSRVRAHEDLFSESRLAPPFSPPASAQLEQVVHIRSSHGGNRDEEIARVRTLLKAFLRKDVGRRFAHEQIMVVLLELVKNTLDHSSSDAFLGMQIKGDRFSFNYADTGNGIAVSVRKFLMSRATLLQANGDHLEAARYERLAEKGAFADFIQWALKAGNSTKLGNGINFGFGLMLIVEAARNCGVRLAIRDADTYLLLTSAKQQMPVNFEAETSHAFVRQRGVTTSAPPLLLFHGEIDFRRRLP